MARVVHLHERPGAGRLGRHIEHDDRSYGYRAVVSDAPLVSVKHLHHGTVLDQGALGSCTGNAMAGLLKTEPFWKLGRIMTESKAVRLYKLATTLDSIPGVYPPSDTGSSGLAVAKAAVKLGYITRYSHAFGIDEALRALQLVPVITGVPWMSTFDTPDAEGIVRYGGYVRGGHEFLVNEYDHDRALVGCYNSWGLPWGLKGRFYMPVETWAKCLGMHGDVTTAL